MNLSSLGKFPSLKTAITAAAAAVSLFLAAGTASATGWHGYGYPGSVQGFASPYPYGYVQGYSSPVYGLGDFAACRNPNAIVRLRAQRNFVFVRCRDANALIRARFDRDNFRLISPTYHQGYWHGNAYGGVQGAGF